MSKLLFENTSTMNLIWIGGGVITNQATIEIVLNF